MRMLFCLIGILLLGCSLRTEPGGIFRPRYITLCLTGKRTLSNLTSFCGAYFSFIFTLPSISRHAVLFSISSVAFQHFEKLKINIKHPMVRVTV